MENPESNEKSFVEKANDNMKEAMESSQMGMELAKQRIDAAIKYVVAHNMLGGGYGFDIAPDEDLELYKKAFEEINNGFANPDGFQLEITEGDGVDKKPMIFIRMPNQNTISNL